MLSSKGVLMKHLKPYLNYLILELKAILKQMNEGD